MKNILLMVPRLNMGGAETYTYRLALLLKSKGYNVFVASGGGTLNRLLKKQGITTSFLPMRLSTSLCALWLQFIVNKYKIDLIHANSAAAGITAVKFKQRGNNLPIIFTAHGVINPKEASYLKTCDQIISVSNFLKTNLVERGIPEEKITTIYTGIDTEHFNPQKIEAISRIDLKIPYTAFTAIQVARVRNLVNKGHNILLDIYAHYFFARNWHLIVVGEGSKFKQLKEEVKRLNLEDRVHLVGQQTNVAAYIKAADIVVSPSRFETFGLALAEAMAMGKAAVAFQVGGVKEVIKEGETGYLVNYPETEEFALAMEKLANDLPSTKIMGKAAREDIAARFPINNMLTNILEIYERSLKASE